MNLKLAPGCRYYGGVVHDIALDLVRQLLERTEVKPTESAVLRPYERRLYRPSVFHVSVSRMANGSESVSIALQLGGGIERFRYEVAVQTHRMGLEESIRNLRWQAAVMVAEGYGPYVTGVFPRYVPDAEPVHVASVPLPPPRKTLPTNHPLRHSAFIARFLSRLEPACAIEYNRLLTVFLHRFPESDEEEFNRALDNLCEKDRTIDLSVSGTEYVELKRAPEGRIPCVTSTEALVAIEISHRINHCETYAKAGTRELYRTLKQYDPFLKVEDVSGSLLRLVERGILSQSRYDNYALNVHRLYVLSAHPDGCHTVSV